MKFYHFDLHGRVKLDAVETAVVGCQKHLCGCKYYLKGCERRLKQMGVEISLGWKNY